MTFKVGDRVRDLENSDEGTIRGLEDNKIWVEWDDIDTDWAFEDELQLVAGEETSFEQSVRYHTNKIADLLIAKNKAYGDSALNPVRIFSKASRIEQLNVRIDDKISRIQRGTDFGDEDTVRDLCGYLLMLMIARESE